MSIFNKDDVLEFLPHRDPFLFVDEILEINLQGDFLSNEIEPKKLIGSEIKGCFKVGKKLKLLEGHFPGAPILPGVIQVEMMAQVCPFIFKHAFHEVINDHKINVQLLGVDKARFKLPIIPEEKLTVIAKLNRVRGNIQSYSCELFNSDNKLVSSADVLASIDFQKESI